MGNEEIDWSRVGRLMKRARVAANIPLRAVGRQLGVSHSAVAAWESGANRPNLDQLMGLARVHRCRSLAEYLHLIGIIDRTSPRQWAEWIEGYYAAEDRAAARGSTAVATLEPEPDDEGMVTHDNALSCSETHDDNEDKSAQQYVNYASRAVTGTLSNHLRQVQTLRRMALSAAG